MVGRVSLQKMWTVNFKIIRGTCLLFPRSTALAVVFILGCESSERSHPQVDHTQVQLAISFPEWSRAPSKSQVVLTFSNPTTQPHTIVLPCPLSENATQFASSDRPTLVLAAKESSRQDEEEAGFVLADLSKGVSDQSKVLTLKPGESVQVPYALASFYLYGHAGPQESDGFLKCLQPGEHEVVVRAIIAYSDVEPEKGDHIASSSIALKCTFPNWLFKMKAEKAGRSSDTGKDSHK